MRHSKLEPYLYIAPAAICIALIYFYPVVRLVTLSLHKPVGGRLVFVGLENYRWLFRDEVFLQAIKNNATLLICVPIMVVLALLLAVLLYEQIRGWRFYRLTVFLPYLLAITVVGVIFGYIFQLNGVLNEFLRHIGLGMLAQDWLGKSRFALPTVMTVIIWKEAGFGVVLFLARLMSVEEELFEAARLDGANWWRLQWHITIPQLSTVLEFFTVVGMITMLSWVFNYIYVMTGGGPGKATMVTELYVYLMGFRYNLPNLASAVSVLLLAVTVILIFIQLQVRETVSTAVE